MNLTEKQKAALDHARRWGEITTSQAHGNTLRSLVQRGYLERDGTFYYPTAKALGTDKPSPFT